MKLIASFVKPRTENDTCDLSIVLRSQEKPRGVEYITHKCVKHDSEECTHYTDGHYFYSPYEGGSSDLNEATLDFMERTAQLLGFQVADALIVRDLEK